MTTGQNPATAYRPSVPLPRSSVRVNKDTYRASHGVEPRGRGSWLFEFGHGVTVHQWRAPYNTPFSAARKMAQGQAAMRGYREVTVMP